MTKRRVLGWVVAALLVTCVAVIFWPPFDISLRYASVTTYYVTQDQMVPAEKAMAEADSILAEARRLSAEGELTPERLFTLQKRMSWLDKHAEQYGPQPRLGHVFVGQRMMLQLVGIRDSDKKFRSLAGEEHDRYRNFFTTDPEYIQIEKFVASTTTSNRSVVALRYVQRFMMTIPMGMIICFLLILREGGSTGYVASVVFGHPFWMAFYPVGILWILGFSDWQDYRENIRRLVSWMSYATAASISIFCGGAASAQSVKKDGVKKSAGYSLQLDNRVTVPVEGPPPSVFNRTTLNARNWLVESISTATPETGAWYNETGAGLKIVHKPQTTVSVLGIMSNDSNGTSKGMLGMQYFHTSPIATIAVPVARIEKTIGGPTALAVATNPLFRLSREGVQSRLALSPDVFVRKTFGRPVAWTAGLGFDVFPRKKKGDRAEIALLRTSSQQWQVRGRYVINFAF